MDIGGVTALVTGAGSGLGAATAKALATGGANVAVLDLNAENANAVAKAIGGLACVADVADEDGVNQALDAVAAKWEAPRIVVSCAGIGPAGRVVGRDGPHSLAVFEKTLRVNLVGTFNVMRLTAARELARFGIRVAAIAPGVIRTPLLDTLPKEVADRIEALSIFPHRFGHAEEYASLVLSIVGNKLLNGTTIRLDGAVRLPPQ
jgi:NAD(P)-dependent dehydrogenase (short-subunit alcohol dehydrogenase family)